MKATLRKMDSVQRPAGWLVCKYRTNASLVDCNMTGEIDGFLDALRK